MKKIVICTVFTCFCFFSCSGVLLSKPGKQQQISFAFNPSEFIANRRSAGDRAAIGNSGAIWTRVEVLAAVGKETQSYHFKREPAGSSSGGSADLIQITIERIETGTTLNVCIEVYGVLTESDKSEVLIGYGESGTVTVTEKTTTVTVKADYPIQVDLELNGGFFAKDSPLRYFVKKGDNLQTVVTQNPLKAGYAFSGWYKDSDFTSSWDFGKDRVTADPTTLYARWEPVSLTVTFDSMGGTAIPPANVVYEGKVPKPTPDPTKAGYSFAGWYRDTTFDLVWNFGNDTVTDNLTLYAKWTTEPVYKVSFILDYEEVSEPVEVERIKGQKIDDLPKPIMYGHIFEGWYRDTTFDLIWNLDTDTVEADITLYARWTAINYIVTFETDGGTLVAPANAVYGGKVPKPTADPTKTGYIFEGWYSDTTFVFAWDFDTHTVEADITLYARYLVAGSLTLKTAAGGVLKAYGDSSHTTEITGLAAIAEGTIVYLKGEPADSSIVVTDIQGADSYTAENGSAVVTVTAEAKTITPAFGTIGLTFTGGSVAGYTGESTTVIIPARKNGVAVTGIGDRAFYNCSALETVTIPSSVTNIGDFAFAGCGALNMVTIPSSVTGIGMMAFYNCSALTTVTIPEGVTSIGNSAFSGSSLTSFIVASGNTTYSALDGVLFNKDKTTLIVYPVGKTAESYTIPASVTSIGNSAFFGSSLKTVTIPSNVKSIGSIAFDSCSSLETVTILEGATSIGDSAFNHCTSLTTITIPSSVISIGTSAFNWCTSLSELTIPSSVTSIGDTAFRDCSSLLRVRIEATTPPVLGRDPFLASNALVEIKVPLPESVVELYKAAPNWNLYADKIVGY